MKNLKPIVIMCLVEPSDLARMEVARAPWAVVEDVFWIPVMERLGRRLDGMVSRPLWSVGMSVTYDLDDCPVDKIGQVEAWARSEGRKKVLEEFSDPILLSIDADEVCLNPVEFAAELRAHPSDRAFWARWRTIVHDDGDYAVGPWSKSEPDGPIKPGWSACSGFQISGRGEFAGNGRATVEARPPRRSCGMFLHRSWDVVTARAKLRAWRRDVDRGDVFAAALEVMHRCRGDLVRLNGAIHGLRNWGPYPNAPWESYAIWDSDDVAKLEARPFFIGSENEEEP